MPCLHSSSASPLSAVGLHPQPVETQFGIAILAWPWQTSKSALCGEWRASFQFSVACFSSSRSAPNAKPELELICDLIFHFHSSRPAELQGERPGQGGAVHHQHGHHPGNLHEVCQRQADPAHLAGQVWGAGRLHERGVPGGDAPADAERSGAGSTAVRRGPAHRGRRDRGADERVRRAEAAAQTVQVHGQHLHLPDLRRLPPAALPLLQRVQEVRAPQPLHCRVRGPQVHELRRGGPGQVPQLLSRSPSPSPSSRIRKPS